MTLGRRLRISVFQGTTRKEYTHTCGSISKCCDLGKSVSMYSLHPMGEEGSVYKLAVVLSDAIGKKRKVNHKGENSKRNATDLWVHLY